MITSAVIVIYIYIYIDVCIKYYLIWKELSTCGIKLPAFIGLHTHCDEGLKVS